LGRQKVQKDGARCFTPKCCPYIRARKMSGVAVPWCVFLKLGEIASTLWLQKGPQRQPAAVFVVGFLQGVRPRIGRLNEPHLRSKQNFDSRGRPLGRPNGKNEKLIKNRDDLDPEPSHMHAGGKAIHLRTRRKGTIPSWKTAPQQRLRGRASAQTGLSARRGDRPDEKVSLLQLARRR
jgi:hypothetical protein